MKTKYLTLDNASHLSNSPQQIAYYDSAQGATTLLFIHGAFIHKGYWRAQLDYFSPRYRVVALDLPGHGQSTVHRAHWSTEQFGQDLVAFIQQLDLQNIVLIGHSFGTDVLLETVTRHPAPIKALVSVDHLKTVGAAMPPEQLEQLLMHLKADFANTCAQYAQQALVTEATDEALVARLLNDYTSMNPDVGIPMLEYGFQYSDRETALLQTLPLPLHLIHVDYTPTDEARLRQYLGNNYVLHHLKGTSHYPMVERATAFNSALEKILEQFGKPFN
jgi:pimeloyl-ACP methyl ester carboxylesterase